GPGGDGRGGQGEGPVHPGRLGEQAENRQQSCDQRQGEAVDHAQAGQADGGGVAPGLDTSVHGDPFRGKSAATSWDAAARRGEEGKDQNRARKPRTRLRPRRGARWLMKEAWFSAFSSSRLVPRTKICPLTSAIVGTS